MNRLVRRIQFHIEELLKVLKCFIRDAAWLRTVIEEICLVINDECADVAPRQHSIDVAGPGFVPQAIENRRIDILSLLSVGLARDG